MPNPNVLASPEPVRGFCDGCGRNMGDKCEVINEPWFIEAERGCCWAKVTPDQAKKIDKGLLRYGSKEYKRVYNQRAKEKRERTATA